METLTHWTQNSTTDFVYSISSNFVAQIETKIEKEDISQNEVASKMGKTSGRVSQVLNNPGNLSTRIMVELARAVDMKVSIVAYDDGDANNEKGPIDPDVFVKCWENAGRPANLFDFEDAPTRDIWDVYITNLGRADLSIGAGGQMAGYGLNVPGYINYLTVKTVEPAKLRNFQIVVAPQMSDPFVLGQNLSPSQLGGFHGIWHQQESTTLAPHQENPA